METKNEARRAYPERSKRAWKSVHATGIPIPVCAAGCCIECLDCSAKPGSPTLCAACLGARASCRAKGGRGLDGLSPYAGKSLIPRRPHSLELLVGAGPRWTRDGFDRCRGPGHDKWLRFLAAAREEQVMKRASRLPWDPTPAVVAALTEAAVDHYLAGPAGGGK